MITPAKLHHAAGHDRGEDFREVRVGAGNWWTLERPRKVAIVAMRRAPCRKVDTPIRRWRDWLEAQLAGRRDDDCECRLGDGIACVGGEHQAVVRQLDNRQTELGGAVGDRPAVCPSQCTPRNQDTLGPPQSRLRRRKVGDGGHAVLTINALLRTTSVASQVPDPGASGQRIWRLGSALEPSVGRSKVSGLSPQAVTGSS